MRKRFLGKNCKKTLTKQMWRNISNNIFQKNLVQKVFENWIKYIQKFLNKIYIFWKDFPNKNWDKILVYNFSENNF
jgi:hypothetical protein